MDASATSQSALWDKLLLVDNTAFDLKANEDELYRRSMEALDVDQQFLAMLENEQKTGEDSALLQLDACCEMAAYFAEQGDGKWALKKYISALELCCDLFGPESLRVAEINDTIGGVLSDMGENEQAISYHLVALHLYKLNQGKHDELCPSSLVEISNIHCSIGICYRQLDDSHNALLHLESAMTGFLHMAARRESFGFDLETAVCANLCANVLALVYQDEDECELASQSKEKALEFTNFFKDIVAPVIYKHTSEPSQEKEGLKKEVVRTLSNSTRCDAPRAA